MSDILKSSSQKVWRTKYVEMICVGLWNRSVIVKVLWDIIDVIKEDPLW
jgi:hypothetical protein